MRNNAPLSKLLVSDNITGEWAPIALFVYNRPEHARRTLDALCRNEGAEHSRLFIFADGAKEDCSAEERSLLGEVRQVVSELRWGGKVEVIKSPLNRGLKESICRGVSNVLSKYDKVIVLEDDLETSPGFLKYMNDALTIYAEQDEVFQISGFMVNHRTRLPDTGFLRSSTSWGWGTWRRAWNLYRDDVEYLLAEVAEKGRAEFDLDGFSFHFSELERNVNGDLCTWAVRWYASIYLNDGLCLYPKRTLVRNHGFDGSGVHCHNDSSHYYQKLRFATDIKVTPQSLIENSKYKRAMQVHYRKMLQKWTGTRIRDRIAKKLGRFLVTNR